MAQTLAEKFVETVDESEDSFEEVGKIVARMGGELIEGSYRDDEGEFDKSGASDDDAYLCSIAAFPDGSSAALVDDDGCGVWEVVELR